jgi:hypothetical protein
VARSEAEFLEYATKSATDDEFDVLIGLSKQADTSATADKTRIPES